MQIDNWDVGTLEFYKKRNISTSQCTNGMSRLYNVKMVYIMNAFSVDIPMYNRTLVYYKKRTLISYNTFFKYKLNSYSIIYKYYVFTYYIKMTIYYKI